jgi:UDP-N-acetylglucosamine 2-epimerase (non-hydrolysing)
LKRKNKTKILFIFGTRPEAIKLVPLIKKFDKSTFQIFTCSTGQHEKMLKQVLSLFEIVPDYELNVMIKNQTLTNLTYKLIKKLDNIIDLVKPDLVFVQGDTTSALISALMAFYNKIPIAHVEAGLRSFKKYSPFPEEINRLLISRLADLHFCPTNISINNLKKEGIKSNIYKVGNTVIDALSMILRNISNDKEKKFYSKFCYLDFSKKIILITGHRREIFGKPLIRICKAIKKSALKNKNVQFLYPVHLNPTVRKIVFRLLSDLNNVFLIDPINYEEMIWILSKSYFVLTDSGGIQEEAPSLGKPVLVMREVTERIEGIKAGNAILVGTNPKNIYNTINRLLNDKKFYNKISKIKNPYGDGKSADRIIKIIKKYFGIK